MRRKLILVGLMMALVGSIYVFTQRTTIPHELKVISFDDISKLKEPLTGTTAIRFTPGQWKRITRDVPIVEGSLFPGSIQLIPIPLREGGNPLQWIFGVHRCPSEDPDVQCLPVYEPGPVDEPIFVGCECRDIITELEVEGGPPTVGTISPCKFMLAPGGTPLASCSGECPEGKDCETPECKLVKSRDGLPWLGCDCGLP